MNQKSDMDPRILQKLNLLQTMPARNSDKENIGLVAFLQEAQEIASTVTQHKKERHNWWMHALQSKFVVHQKEQSTMFSVVSTILLIASLILGGGGVTIAAAQNNQPDQPLYGVKVWSEDVRLGVSTDPQSEYQIALEFTNRRAQEIQTMLQVGSIPPQTVHARYQAQIENTIQYALNLSDNEAILALNKIRMQLQTQQQSFLHVQTNGSPNAESALLQTRQMLQDRLQWVETGLIDPAKLRVQLRLRDRTHQQDPLSSVQPTQAVPSTGIGNPWTTGTPTSGSSYGPGKGTGDCESCTPNTTGQGSNPWTIGTPTPGSGYGPGPGQDPTRTCTPGSGSNSQPTRLQNNQPTQAGPQQQQNNQPAQAGPQTGQGSGSPSNGPGPQATSGSGNSGGATINPI